MSSISDLHEQWMQAPEYRKAIQDLAPEFENIRTEILNRLHQEEDRVLSPVTKPVRLHRLKRSLPACETHPQTAGKSSFSRYGNSARISSSVIPEASMSRTSQTVTRSPRIQGCPDR